MAEPPSDLHARVRRGVELLAQGRYAEGFQLYGAWRHDPAYRQTASGAAFFGERAGLPLWTGEDLTGRRLLVLSEEGFGDQIMYSRFVRGLPAAEVLWLCPPELQRLFQHGLGVTAVRWDQPFDLGVVHNYIASSSLPERAFPPLVVPPPAPYLLAPPARTIAGKSIGVMTAGSPVHPNDANRSLSAEAAAQLLAQPDALDLSPAATGAQDFYETAQIIAGLDLVIAVDTSVAHLAAAMGKETWVLLPRVGVDWRWRAAPWYGAARLVHEDPQGWPATIARLLSELAGRPRSA